MTLMRSSLRALLSAFVLSLLLFTLACGQGGDTASTDGGEAPAERRFLSLGTAPTGGAFFVVGGALAEVADKNSETWTVTAEATAGTQENIRRLTSGDLDFAMANAAISYFATSELVVVDPENGTQTTLGKPAAYATAEFSPDGNKVVFSSSLNAKSPYEFNIFTADWVE